MTTDQTELVTRINSYIRHQVAKGPATIQRMVQQGHQQLVGLIDSLSEEQAHFKPGPDDWSVLEVLQHAAPAERWVADVCSALARGAPPASRAEAGRMGSDFSSLAAARSALGAAHQELLAFVDNLSPEANRETRFDHPFFGPLNCEEWAVFQRVHNGDHAQQIEQILAAPGFPEA